MQMFSEMNDLVEMLMKERKFNPLEYRRLYFLYSKKVDDEVKIDIDAAYHVYFTSDSHKQDFRIHQLEFDDIGEWMYWHAKGLKEEKARINGIRTLAGTFYGNIKTNEGRRLDVVARNLRILEVRGEKKRLEDCLPLYGLMAYPIKSVYPSEKTL